MESQDSILGRYRGWVESAAKRLAFSYRDYSSWGDVAQEGWVAMWKALQTFDPQRGAEASYLTRAAHMGMLNCLRRDLWTGQPSARGHVREKPATPTDDEFICEVAVTYDPYDSVEWAYHNGELMEALSRISNSGRTRALSVMAGSPSKGGVPPRDKQLLSQQLSHLKEEV